MSACVGRDRSNGATFRWRVTCVARVWRVTSQALCMCVCARTRAQSTGRKSRAPLHHGARRRPLSFTHIEIETRVTQHMIAAWAF